MPLIKSSASTYYTTLVAITLLLSEIMPSCSYYKEKKLVYIIIAAPFNCQTFSYIKCIKLNMHLSYNIRLVSNTKYLYLIHPCSLQSLQLLCLICLRVSYSIGSEEAQ